MTEKKQSPWAGTKLWDVFDIPKQKCPYCGYVVDASTLAATTNEKPSAPKKGDLNICLRCMRVSAYGDDLHLVEISLDEEKKIKNKPEIKKIMRAMIGVKAMYKKEEK